MKIYRQALSIGLLAVCLFALTDRADAQVRSFNDYRADTDDYWSSYWNWYDGYYQPYYGNIARQRDTGFYTWSRPGMFGLGYVPPATTYGNVYVTPPPYTYYNYAPYGGPIYHGRSIRWR